MKIRITGLFLAYVFLLAGCSVFGGSGEYRDFVFFAMDTYVTVRLSRDGVSEDTLTQISAECERISAELENVLSAHDPTSELYALNASEAETVEVSDALMDVLTKAYDIAEITGGAFDFTLGSLSSLWNITGGGPVPSKDDIAKALSHTGYTKISLDTENLTVSRTDTKIQIDLGGIGKGALADALIEYLKTTDVLYGTISVGGNVGVFGEKPDKTPFEISLRDPDNPNKTVGYFEIYDGFVAVSGDYERYFEEDGIRYNHILNGSTGYPVFGDLREDAVYCASGAYADAFSTAVFVLGYNDGYDMYESSEIPFEVVFVLSDNIISTPKARFN